MLGRERVVDGYHLITKTVSETAAPAVLQIEVAEDTESAVQEHGDVVRVFWTCGSPGRPVATYRRFADDRVVDGASEGHGSAA